MQFSRTSRPKTISSSNLAGKFETTARPPKIYDVPAPLVLTLQTAATAQPPNLLLTEGSDTRADTQKQTAFWVRPPKEPGNSKPVKTHSEPNRTATLSNSAQNFRYHKVLVSILQPKEQQVLPTIFGQLLTIAMHIEKPCKIPIKPTRLGFLGKTGFCTVHCRHI